MVDAVIYSVSILGAAALLVTALAGRSNKLSVLVGELALAGSAAVWLYSVYPLRVPLLATARASMGGFYHDGLSAVVSLTVLFVGALVIPASVRLERGAWQFVFALMLGVAGTIALSSSTNPLIVVAAWGLVAVSSYSMVSLAGDRDSLIGSVKYAFMSALSFQFLIISTLILSTAPASSKLLVFGMILFFVALGFKAGIPPFHMWLPDVYGYSDPVPVSMLSSSMKLGALALAVRLIEISSSSVPAVYGTSLIAILVVLSLAGMLVGNLGALTQREVQRMMAYSSIAHVGYMTMALAVLCAAFEYNSPGASYFALIGLLIYFASYALSKAGVFAYIRGSKPAGSRLTVQGFEGLGSVFPLASGSFSVILLNLIGVPPLLGFWGKLFIFASAANPALPLFFVAGIPWFALLGILNSALSVFYYVKLIRSVYSTGSGSADFRGLMPAVLASVALVVLGLLLPLFISL